MIQKKKIVNVPVKELDMDPLTKEEIQETARERVHLIAKEFTDGFSFLENFPKSVTFFGGTHFKEHDPYYIKARSLATKISKDLGYTVLTGGGPGIMEAANRGAYEAKGQSVGLTIELAQHQIHNKYLTKNLNFYYFFSRKVCLSFSAEAYIFFPGGFGTLDEFFEIVTLVQTGKIEKVPIILLCSDFWKPLDNLIRKELLGRGTVDLDDVSLYKITDDEGETLEIIKNAPVRNGVKFKHSNKDFESSGIVIEPNRLSS